MTATEFHGVLADAVDRLKQIPGEISEALPGFTAVVRAAVEEVVVDFLAKVQEQLRCAADVKRLVADMPDLTADQRKTILTRLAGVDDILVTDYRAAFYDDEGNLRAGVCRLVDGASEVFVEWDRGFPQRLRLQVFADSEPVAGLTARPGAVRQLIRFIESEMPVGISDDGARRSDVPATVPA